MEIITTSAKATKALGEKIAGELNTYKKDKAKIFALVGNLGGGKTTFVQGMAKGLKIKQRIISPTFIILRKYQLENKRYKSFYHIDLYRLEDNIEKELKNIGIDEIWNDKENIIAIEWAEKAKKIIPKNAKWITFEYLKKGKRKILIK